MKIILKGCTQDVLAEISEKLGSQVVSECDFIGAYDDTDEDIFRIELDSKMCRVIVQPEWVNIIRDDVTPWRYLTIADFRFEEVIIK